jgi:hypothetical protein
MNLQQIMDFVKMSGKSPKEMFMTMAQQKGVDPEMIINQLKQK